MNEGKGQIAEDPRKIPEMLEDMSDEEIRQKKEEVDRETFNHLYMQDGMLLYDGTRKIGNIETIKSYGDFELVMDWKIGPIGDSGIFLRNMPQVQIWDPHHQGVGSGGLYNNDPKVEPLVETDKPVGEWNRMIITMISDSVWVKLNDKMAVDGAIQEKLWADYKDLLPRKAKLYFKVMAPHSGLKTCILKNLTEIINT